MRKVIKKTENITLYWENVRYNLGNTLQSYAMHSTLNKISESKLICFGTLSVKHKIIQTLKKLKRIILKIEVQERKQKRLYENFYRHIKIKKRNYGFKYAPDVYYVCGSDQIWNPFYGGKSEFFAYGAQAEHRIAYAASFGVSSLDDDTKTRYAEYLKDMEYISVREDRAAELVHDLTGRNVPVVLDPTLLLDRDEWSRVSKKPKFETGKFILTYFLGNCEKEYAKYISDLAEKMNCSIINLEFLNKNKYWYKTGPAEFLWLINHCEYMCTDSFHGSVFSIINEKPFLVFDRIDDEQPMNSRLDTLLSKFGLNDRRYAGQQIEDVVDIDYGNINTIMENEKKKSLVFLKDALQID